MQRNRILSALAGAALLFAGAPVRAQTIDSASIAGMRWRELGPANFEGRMSDVVGIPSPSKTLFVAAAGGGIWKTTNNGVTWRPVFDDKRVISMGMLAIAPSDTMQVWAGTGEPNSRNTIEAGAGVYKSTDGGITWKFMGLEKTQHIGRIVVNPRDPNTVYVAALGAAWKSSPERGLYKTTDGGVTWKLVKFISDKAGFVDVALDPRDPNIVYAAAWERFRTPYSLHSGGPGSGLWKSTDAGATWTEIKGGGFPEGAKGRIGLAISLSDPNYIYAEVEAAAPSKDGSFVPSRTPAGTGLYRSTDAGKTWTRTNTADTRPFYYSQVRVDPKNRDRVYFSSTQIQVSDDGGTTARPAAQQVHVDDHGMWIDPNDPERFAIANDGGMSITFDRGGNFIQTTNLPIGQFYEITYDYSVPYNVCSGAQDNGAWCGPSRRKQGGTPNAYWFTISGGDGFYTAMDPTDPNIVYGESQGGNASRLNLKTGERMNFVKPSWQARYKEWEDSMAIVRGDPLRPETKEMAKTLAGMRAQQKQDSVDLNLRFNWNSPYFISPHNPAVIYFAGNRVLKSMQRGENFQLISPDLSKKEWAKIDTSLVWTGGITIDATQAETFGTVVALSESYVKPGLLFAGTDDGNVWKSPNDGATWESLNGRFPGLPNNSWVSRIEPSHFDTLTFYVTFEDHRVNDFTPYIYATNDGGKTFRSIVNDLPKDGVADFVHVIREDPSNRDLLFVGTSLSVYASIDRGAHWTKFASNLPSVAVYDLKIHPRDHELMAATHGRSLWAVDVVPIEQMSARTLAASATLFAPKTALQYGEGPTLSSTGNGNAQMYFSVPSPPYGAELSYRLGAGSSGGVRLHISDVGGDTIATLNGPGGAGVHTVFWNYQGTHRVVPVVAMLSPSERRDSILKAVRAPMVLDSLTKAGFDPAAVSRVRQLLAGGGAPGGGRGGRGGGGGGGRGAASCDHPLTMWESFCARPGEGEAAAAGGGGGRGANAEPANVLKIYTLIGIPAPLGGGRGGGGRGGADAAPGAFTAGAGDYLVTMSVGSQTYKQVLHVEHVSGSEDGGFQFGGTPEKQP
jgi:photosystem II stability/assembly factor-like uncharacterized protein